jgi:hypothetical protein
MRSRTEHESPVAIGTLDEIVIAHLEIDAGMTERAVAAVAGDPPFVHRYYFRSFDRHGIPASPEPGS